MMVPYFSVMYMTTNIIEMLIVKLADRHGYSKL